MQNNAEQIFDDFLRGRLDTVTPDTTMLDTSFSTFMQERNDRKKKRRFFWLLFLFLFIALPFTYYISGINQPTNHNPGSVQPKTSVEPTSPGNNKQETITGITADSIEAEIKNNEPAKVSAFPPGKKLVQGAGIDIKDSANAKNGPSLKNNFPDSAKTEKIRTIVSQLPKTDSLAKKDKPQKEDTFHIVW